MNLIGFTRISTGFRAWFPVSKSGVIATGLVPGDFIATVFSADDAASGVYSVNESSQKSGMYYFDIPSSFFGANGVGQYGATVEVVAAAYKAVAGGVLQVTFEDLNGIEALRYGGVIHIDTASGITGTSYPAGTDEYPVNNLADAALIASATGIRYFHVRGSLTLTQAFPDWHFVGNGEEAEINLNGQDVADTEFSNLLLTGSMSNGPVRLDDCDLDGVSGIYGSGHRCVLLPGTIDLGGNLRLDKSISGVAGSGTPTINYNGGVGRTLEIRGHVGGVRVANMSDAAAKASIDILAGQLIVDATCTAGEIQARGIGNLTDNTGGIGTAIDSRAFLSKPEIRDEILNAILTSYNIDQSVGDALKKLYAILAISASNA